VLHEGSGQASRGSSTSVAAFREPDIVLFEQQQMLLPLLLPLLKVCNPLGPAGSSSSSSSSGRSGKVASCCWQQGQQQQCLLKALQPHLAQLLPLLLLFIQLPLAAFGLKESRQLTLLMMAALTGLVYTAAAVWDLGGFEAAAAAGTAAAASSSRSSRDSR